jgi:ribosome biogenesis protein BMS1
MQGLSLGGGAGDSDSDDELFRPKRPQSGEDAGAGAGAGGADAADALDSSRVAVPPEVLDAWRDEGAAERLRNRFVTGGWRPHRVSVRRHG